MTVPLLANKIADTMHTVMTIKPMAKGTIFDENLELDFTVPSPYTYQSIISITSVDRIGH